MERKNCEVDMRHFPARYIVNARRDLSDYSHENSKFEELVLCEAGFFILNIDLVWLVALIFFRKCDQNDSRKGENHCKCLADRNLFVEPAEGKDCNCEYLGVVSDLKDADG